MNPKIQMKNNISISACCRNALTEQFLQTIKTDDRWAYTMISVWTDHSGVDTYAGFWHFAEIMGLRFRWRLFPDRFAGVAA